LSSFIWKSELSAQVINTPFKIVEFNPLSFDPKWSEPLSASCFDERRQLKHESCSMETTPCSDEQIFFQGKLINAVVNLQGLNQTIVMNHPRGASTICYFIQGLYRSGEFVAPVTVNSINF
jgi:hypothetical protein